MMGWIMSVLEIFRGIYIGVGDDIFTVIIKFYLYQSSL